MKKAANKKITADIILIVGCLVIAAVLYFFISFGSEQGSKAVVRVNGEICAQYPLNIEGTFELNGGTNTLVIEDGCAYLIEANCPDHICVHQGKISRNGQTITCLPNRLTVTIEGGESDVDIYIG